MKSIRVDYFDMLRGVAIIFVVAIHSIGSSLSLPSDTFNYNATIFLRNALNIAVPIFITISGYFLSRKSIKNFHDYLNFTSRQITKIYVPVLIWSVVWLLINIVTNKGTFITEFIKLISFRSNEPYYFVFLIIQFYIFLPFLAAINNKKGLAFSIFFSLISTLFVLYIRYFSDIELPVIVYGGNSFVYLMFFVLGMYVGSGNKINITTKSLKCWIVVFYVLSCLESYLLIYIFGQVIDGVSAVRPFSFVFSLFVIYYLISNKKEKTSKCMVMLGKVSFGVFLTHNFAIIFINKIILTFINIPDSLLVFYQAFLIFLVVLSCFLVIKIAKFNIPKKYGKLLGLF